MERKTTETRQISIDEYNYSLPDSRIAKYPLTQRDRSLLLVYKEGKLKKQHFYDLPDYVPAGSMMVFNNTKVIQARMHFRKETGALIEIFCLEPVEPKEYILSFDSKGYCSWLCMVGNVKKWKGEVLKKNFLIDGKEVSLQAICKERREDGFEIEFSWQSDYTFAEILEVVGELPIPPYLNRDTEEADKITYQTVYSKIEGSVAAPTAGLHFTNKVLNELQKQGVLCSELTLHVGAGTFKPVKTQTIGEHDMHTETFFVTGKLIEDLITHPGKVIAVGTTSVRTLESLYYIGQKIVKYPDIAVEKLKVEQWEPYNEDNTISSGEALQAISDYMRKEELDILHTATRIMIAPGYSFKIVSAIVTNFHQPCSTLLLLVSAFVKGNWKTIYDFALANDFRFLSYGDSSILFPD